MGIKEAIQHNIALESYYVQFLALGWNKQAWEALLSWIKKRNLPFFATLDWAKKATAFGVPPPEDLDMNEWDKRVRTQLPQLWSDSSIIERFLSNE